ncbi:hypothetical protein SAMN05421753_11637 [Planctomicrobium piriforme]|uniref:Carboxypeptidase regulatory-like domain-containing protein n=2 Tax=Planctomicrobium piriforme TaxID=1576369 RepID=A0A1I3P4N6_9PLAN|nr:hypothetical protein SAMN05421753_11637 [Planctomicrobium piriforme]
MLPHWRRFEAVRPAEFEPSRRAALSKLLGMAPVLAFSRLLQAESYSRRGLPPRACDLLLQNGTLTGRYVTEKGNGVSHAMATLRSGGQRLSTQATDNEGGFAFTGVESGLYEVAVGNRSEFVRAWNPAAAPAGVWPTLILVQDGRTIGASGPYAAVGLMGPGGSPADLAGIREPGQRLGGGAEFRRLQHP